MIANIASPGSVRNILLHASACVSFVDIFVQKGFKVHGRADLVRRSDPRYIELAEPLEGMVQDKFDIHGIIEVRATAVEPIVAPSYQFYEDTTEETRVQDALTAYGASRPSGSL